MVPTVARRVNLGEEDSGSISGERTGDTALRHVPQGHLAGRDLYKARERDQGGCGHRVTGIKEQAVPEEEIEEVWGVTVTGGQAKDLITEEAKTVDITRVPLNFLPMAGKLAGVLVD